MTQIQNQAKILVGVIDHLPPEAQAMIIAKYSRSYGTVQDWIPNADDDSAIESLMKRMGMTFLGYGHKSVGQLGHTTIFLEGISQIAAKAFEDDQLFNGQESSTRYIDYSTQPMVVLEHHPEYDQILRDFQEKFRALYIRALPLVTERLKSEFPFEDAAEFENAAITRKRTIWANTIKARTFDICRGLLPAGGVTNVAFTGTFDLINDHFGALLYHPSSEIRTHAKNALISAREVYPHGIETVEKLEERFSFIAEDPRSYFYHRIEDQPVYKNIMDVAAENSPPGRRIHPSIARRVKWDKLPRDVSENYRFRLGGKLDFGSFRDLHRHRNGVILMPLLTPELGFHPWYIKELPPEIGAEAVVLLQQLENAIPTIYDMDVQRQYAVPMGARVRIQYDCGLNQLAYILELRSGKTVHQTLRHWTHQVYDEFKLYSHFSEIAEKVYPDLDVENFTLKRGTQTFNV